MKPVYKGWILPTEGAYCGIKSIFWKKYLVNSWKTWGWFNSKLSFTLATFTPLTIFPFKEDVIWELSKYFNVYYGEYSNKDAHEIKEYSGFFRKEYCFEYIQEHWEKSSISKDRFPMISIQNKHGDIGDVRDAYALLKRGITEPMTRTGKKVCSYGLSTKDGKWYGWSHRAIFGFEIGHIVEEDSMLNNYDKDRYPIGFTAKNTEDCMNMAMTFAASVS